jgi:NADH:ubiquinone oxidoreductase subunit 2 (subunit N)
MGLELTLCNYALVALRRDDARTTGLTVKLFILGALWRQVSAVWPVDALRRHRLAQHQRSV